MMIDPHQLQRAAGRLKQSTRLVALTGAGISTEAGIPDFRSPESGVWNNLELMASFSSWGFRLAPGRFYQHALTLLPPLLKAKPTRTHDLLAELERVGKLKSIITQNIDGLHQQAGSENVIELHGTYRTSHCLTCRAAYEMEQVMAMIDRHGHPPHCDHCRGLIKPDLVLFGDLLPPEALDRATREIEHCDLLMVLGSSLTVSPAADLPGRALDVDATLVIVNRQPTPYDALADVVIQAQLGEFSRRIGQLLDL